MDLHGLASLTRKPRRISVAPTSQTKITTPKQCSSACVCASKFLLQYDLLFLCVNRNQYSILFYVYVIDNYINIYCILVILITYTNIYVKNKILWYAPTSTSRRSRIPFPHDFRSNDDRDDGARAEQKAPQHLLQIVQSTRIKIPRASLKSVKTRPDAAFADGRPGFCVVCAPFFSFSFFGRLVVCIWLQYSVMNGT